jgi:hypothetical protein
MYNISQEALLNISETNDSQAEMKAVTSIPILKNSDKFKSKTSKESNKGGTVGEVMLFS